MSTKAGNPPDQKRIVATLASQCDMTIAEMKMLYERERAQLAIGAHITKYLDIFASRHILEAFRVRDAISPPSLADASAKPERSGA
jgi:hypothetical protein